MRSIMCGVLAIAALDAGPLLAAERPSPSAAGTSIQAADRQGLARRDRRERAELERWRVPARTAATAPVVRPGVGALRVALDPVTGKPTFEVVQSDLALEPQLERSAEGLTIVRHADGSESVHLGERFMEHTVVQIGPNGQKQVECVTSAAEAQRIASGPAAVAAKPAARKPAAPRREK